MRAGLKGSRCADSREQRPVWVCTELLGAPFAVVSAVNHDNNQHARNENVRLGHVFRAVELLAATAAAVVTAATQVPHDCRGFSCHERHSIGNCSVTREEVKATT